MRNYSIGCIPILNSMIFRAYALKEGGGRDDTMAQETPTYEDTLEYHGLSDRDMKEECPENFVFGLVRKIGGRWQGVNLGLERSVVTAIESGSTADSEGKCRQLLERWKEQYGHEATYGRLARSFIESGMANMADIICKDRKKAIEKVGKRNKETQSADRTDFQPFPGTQQQERGGDKEIEEEDDSTTPIQVQSIGPEHRKRGVPSGSSDPNAKSGSGSRTGLQEQSNGRKATDMVTNNSLYEPNIPSSLKHTSDAKSPDRDRDFFRYASLSMEHIDKLREERQAMEVSKVAAEEKKEKLMQRNYEVMILVAKKETQIQYLNKEATELKERLEHEQKQGKQVRIDLAQRHQEISQLKEKQQELKEAREDQQVEVDDLRHQLTELENESDEKEKELAKSMKRIEYLEKKMDDNNQKVNVQEHEMQGLEKVMQWTINDVEEEDEEIDEIAYLKDRITTLERNNRKFKISLIVVVSILSCLVLSRVPYTCLHIFSDDSEL